MKHNFINEWNESECGETVWAKPGSKKPPLNPVPSSQLVKDQAAISRC